MARRLVLVVPLLSLLFLLTFQGTQAQEKSKPEDQTVYITKTGAKYHRDGCSSLAKSKIPIRLGDAVGKYGACAVCKPPTLTQAPAPATTGADPTVYVTRTGQKYHRDGCRSLSQSRIAMKLSEAAKRYGPCSVCKPPTVRAASSHESTSASASSGRQDLSFDVSPTSAHRIAA